MKYLGSIFLMLVAWTCILIGLFMLSAYAAEGVLYLAVGVFAGFGSFKLWMG